MTAARDFSAFDQRIAALGIGVRADRCFGEPHVMGRHIPVSIVVIRFRAGESMAELATDYALSVRQVEDAIRFAMLPRRHVKAWQKRQLPELLREESVPPEAGYGEEEEP